MIESDLMGLLIVIQLAVIIVLTMLVYRSYPAGTVEELLSRVAPYVDKSDTKADDVLLELAGLLNDMRKGDAPTQDGV